MASGSSLMESHGDLTQGLLPGVWMSQPQSLSVCTMTTLTLMERTSLMSLVVVVWKLIPGPPVSALISVRKLLAATTGHGSWMRKSTAS